MREMIFPGIMVIFGFFYLVFAFVAPPDWARSLFRIRSIFVFLPERLARFVIGVMMIGFGVYFATIV